MMHEATFGQYGYEFLGEYMEPEDMKEEKQKKQSVKDTRKAAILEMKEPPLITVSRVMDEFDVKEQTAKLLLSELESTMQLIKYGRGVTAVWKLHEV
jgi:predicted transcriptional regulator of viral defense system